MEKKPRASSASDGKGAEKGSKGDDGGGGEAGSSVAPAAQGQGDVVVARRRTSTTADAMDAADKGAVAAQPGGAASSGGSGGPQARDSCTPKGPASASVAPLPLTEPPSLPGQVVAGADAGGVSVSARTSTARGSVTLGESSAAATGASHALSLHLRLLYSAVLS
jgi:hypothetical protein